MPLPHFPRPSRFFLVVLAVAALAAGAAMAETAPPPLAHDVGAYALYGNARVRWYGAASMPGHAAVGSGASVTLADGTVADGENSYVAAPEVTLEDASRVHFVYADALAADADVVLGHEAAPAGGAPVAALDWPVAPAVDCGGADVTVTAGVSPVLLAPGRYADVVVEDSQVLRLVAGGRYEFCSLRVRPGAAVDASAGTLVLVRDYLLASGRSRLGGEGACGVRWIVAAVGNASTPTGAAIEFTHAGPSARSLVQGDFFTPGRITMAQHNDYVGRFWADAIEGRGADAVTRTLADCRAARCGDGRVDEGEECDDGNNLQGDCCSSFCEVLAEGTACSDGLFCTVDDRCGADGRCAGAGNPCAPPDGDGDCAESCNEDADACTAADPDGSACDDGLWCNGADRCASGGCVAHDGAPCPGPDGDGDCSESCDEATHACGAPDAAGASCEDGRFCTAGDHCDGSGLCAGGYPACPGPDGDGDCAESCDELADSCTAVDAEGAPCEDGLFCSGEDSCDGRGGCRAGSDPCVGRVADGDGDCSETCDEVARSCSAADPDGSPCSDGLACTLGERCMLGACAAGGLTDCDDDNPCTDEFCGADGECVRVDNAAPCDDGNACTLGDRCLAGACTGASEVDCRDGDLCSTDTCDPVDGSCRHAYVPAATCHEFGRSTTTISLDFSAKDGLPVEKLSTSWRSEEGDVAGWREELGDPSAGDPFAVCFYDEAGGLPRLAYRFDLDESTMTMSRWSRRWRTNDLVYRLKLREGTAQGVSSVRIGGGKHGSPTMRLRAGAGGGCGEDCRSKFIPPAPYGGGRYFAMEPGLTVQWRAEGGACWSATYGEASSNDEGSFSATARPPAP